MTFNLSPPFISDPPGCENYASYSCSNIGPNINLCTEGVFDTLTGEYTFSGADKRVFPPGTYTFTVTGSLNGVSSSISFDLNLIDPCTQAVLTLTEGIFDDLNTHVLGKEEQSYSWNRSAISSVDVANCGATTVSFFADSNPIPISGTYLSFFYDK